MINLLPNDMKQDITAARSNVILLRYNVFTATAVIGLVLICLLFFLILSTNQTNATAQSTENAQKAATFAATERDAAEYQKNLTTARAILEKSVDYTSTISEIVKLLPPGVILDGLALKAGDFGKQTSFTASAKSITEATRLKQNFQNSKIFSNVYFQTVNNNSSTPGSPTTAYPIQVVLSVQINKVAAQ